ncbi:MAG: glycosyltransferase family 2 protein [Bacteroidales bacterium]
MKPLISIIVPIYNVEAYLKRCVVSIQNQTYPNIEIILVDDGSPDNSGKLCDELAAKDERIKVIHKPNGGLSDARNAGIDIAQGEFLSFIDSDDYIHPQMMELLYQNLVEAKADLSCCDIKNAYSTEAEYFDFDNTVKLYTNIEALEMLFTYYCQVFVMVCNKLYRKEAFTEFRFAKGKIHEDEFLTYKILHHSPKIVFSDARLYYYYQSPNSIMRSQFSEKRLQYAEAMEERLAYFEAEKLSKFYNLTLQKFGIWSLFFYYLNRASMSKEIRQKMLEIIRKNCDLILEKRIANKVSRLAFALARKYPYLMGFFAHQSVFGLNIVSRFSQFLFDNKGK